MEDTIRNKIGMEDIIRTTALLSLSRISLASTNMVFSARFDSTKLMQFYFFKKVHSVENKKCNLSGNSNPSRVFNNVATSGS